jgi:hypothetical protein
MQEASNEAVKLKNRQIMLDLNKHEAEELIARSRMTGLIMVALRAPALCVTYTTLIRSDLTKSLGSCRPGISGTRLTISCRQLEAVAMS